MKPGQQSNSFIYYTGQGGYTMVELMVAMTLSALLVIVIFQMLIQSQMMAENLIMRVRFNEEARHLFEMVGDGGFAVEGEISGYGGAIEAAFPDQRVPGIRSGRSVLVDPASSGYHYQGYQTDATTGDEYTVNVLADTFYNRFSLQGTRQSSGVAGRINSNAWEKLMCTAFGPSPDCTTAENVDMGMLYNGRHTPASVRNPVIIPNNASAYKYNSVVFQLVDPETMTDNVLFDPDLAAEVTKRFKAINWTKKEYYRTSFYLMGDY